MMKNLPANLKASYKPEAYERSLIGVYTFILFFNLFPHPLKAQQPATHQVAPSSSTVNHWSARAIDSLLRANHTKRADIITPAKHKRVLKAGSDRFVSGTTPEMKIAGNLQNSRLSRTTNTTETLCYTISGRDFLKQDSLMMWTGDPTLTADGNVIVSGEYADYSRLPLLTAGGFCMKTDLQGNIIWAKLFDSTSHSHFEYTNYFKSIELRNGNILLAGRTTNKVSGNDDFVLAMLNKDGNIIWLKTYESKFWQGYNGSGDSFTLKDLEEDPATGDIYFVGNHWVGVSTITKVSPFDGSILWSNGYDTWDADYPFGIVINAGNLLLFQLENGYYNDSYINATAINKVDGDTLYSKHFIQTGDKNAPRLYNTYQLVKQDNGRFLLSGPTTGYWEYPSYTGTKDLYHAAIIELDENLDYVKAFGFKNRLNSNNYNTKISLFPDGSGVFAMLDYRSGFTAGGHVSLFRKEAIYHQRRRLHINEGIPKEPFTLKMPDGGLLNIKLMGDSTRLASEGSRIDYYRMYPSDTASVCLGIKDHSTSIWHFNFEPVKRQLKSIERNVFKESRLKTYNSLNFTASPEPSCRVISHCDTLAMEVSASKICPGTSVVVTIHKNKGCGSLVPLVYDTTWVSGVTRLTDSTYTFHFSKPGKGYISGSLMGCVLHSDSVYVEVLPERDILNIGPDTSLCINNRITLNAGDGFASYKWQDGSTDSTFQVTQPGVYVVTAMNGCGGIYTDTVIVSQAPPIPFFAGADRVKCNNDILQLAAPSGFTNYVWTNSSNNSAVNNQSFVVNPSTDTYYYVRAEKTAGCFAYDTLFVKVNHSPPINLGADTSFCKGNSATFDAGAGFNQYLWNNGSTGQQITVNEPGNYIVTGTTAEGCKSSDTVRVMQVYANPVVTLPQITAICSGSSAVLNAGNFNSYEWNTGSNNASIIVSDVGTYAVTVTDNNGCKGSDTTSILQLYPLPANFLPADTSICSYGSLILKSNAPYNEYMWSNNLSTSSITITKPGAYSLQVTDQNNCTAKETITVYQKDCMKGFYIPSAFTPNGDGKNDIFRPLIFGNVKRFVFTVYNRWGQQVFHTTDINKGWEGKVAVENQGSFVFVWTCRYLIDGDVEKFERGSVTLIR